MEMDDENWSTVGKPKKPKTGANKVLSETKGKKLKRQHK